MKRRDFHEDHGCRRRRRGARGPLCCARAEAARSDQCRPPRRHLHVAALLCPCAGLLQRRRAQRPAQIHAQSGRRHHRARQQRHGHHPQPLHQRLRGGRAGGADPHHRRQRRRRAVHHRAEGVRHQEHGGLSPPPRARASRSAPCASTPSSSRSIATWSRTISPTATTTSSGSTTRCRWPRRSRPRRSMSSPMSSRSRPAWSISSAASRSPATSTSGARTARTA